MLVLGICVLGFIVLHLYNFWFKMQFAELVGMHEVATLAGETVTPTNGAALVKALFTTPLYGQIYCGLYLIWLVALWFHLNHGVWSALHTLGWNNLIWMKRIKVISSVVATLVVGLFAVVVFYYLGVGIGELCA